MTTPPVPFRSPGLAQRLAETRAFFLEDPTLLSGAVTTHAAETCRMAAAYIEQLEREADDLCETLRATRDQVAFLQTSIDAMRAIAEQVRRAAANLQQTGCGK